MRWSLFRSANALVPAIALGGAILVGLVGTFGGIYQGQLYKAQKSQEVAIQAEILAANVSAALALDDRRSAQRFVNALHANPELDFAAVYDARGRELARFSRGRGHYRPPKTGKSRSLIWNNHVEAAVPVIENGQSLGEVYLVSSMDSLRRRLFKYGVVALVAAMSALLLSVLATAQHELSKANQRLTGQARDLFEANSKLQHEIRERARIEEALRQSQKMEAVGQLSGGIAHDFNNFLMIIKGNLHLLKRRMAQGQSDVQRYVDGAIQGVDRAVTVTQRILAFSRRQPLSPEPNNLSDLIRDVLPLIRQSVGAKIEINAALAADWIVYCDRNQMENALINLAVNARDAMPDGGRLDFATKNAVIGEDEAVPSDVLPGEYVELLVSDNGAGMSEDVRARALDPFFTTKPHGKGTGLGLSMTFGFIRQSAGYMEIASAPRKGTVIRILLPRRYV